MVVTLGALMADVAHSRPIPVSATSDSEGTRHRHDLEMSTYEGPTGIVGVLADAATQVGVPSVSCWAAVPHYAGPARRPRRRSGCSTSSSPCSTGRSTRGAGRGCPSVGARNQRNGGGRHRARRVRPEPRGGPGTWPTPRGERRRHREASSSATCVVAATRARRRRWEGGAPEGDPRSQTTRVSGPRVEVGGGAGEKGARRTRHAKPPSRSALGPLDPDAQHGIAPCARRARARPRPDPPCRPGCARPRRRRRPARCGCRGRRRWRRARRRCVAAASAPRFTDSASRQRASRTCAASSRSGVYSHSVR